MEICTASAQPVAFFTSMLALYVLLYTSFLLVSEIVFIERNITLHMAASHIVTHLPTYSKDQMASNLKKFFRDGTFSVSLDDTKIEYPPPKRASGLGYTRGNVEMPAYVQHMAWCCRRTQ